MAEINPTPANQKRSFATRLHLSVARENKKQEAEKQKQKNSNTNRRTHTPLHILSITLLTTQHHRQKLYSTSQPSKRNPTKTRDQICFQSRRTFSHPSLTGGCSGGGDTKRSDLFLRCMYAPRGIGENMFFDSNWGNKKSIKDHIGGNGINMKH